MSRLDFNKVTHKRKEEKLLAPRSAGYAAYKNWRKVGEKLEDVIGRKKYVDENLKQMKEEKYEKGLRMVSEILEIN